MREFLVLPIIFSLVGCFSGEPPIGSAAAYSDHASAACTVAGWQVATPGWSACAARETANPKP
jgi:hypothetical protein